MSTLARAIEIAASAHVEQVDKAGQPYILHPIRVMLAVNTNEERMAAILHDVVEDTDWTMEMLRNERFPEEVLEAVVALTKMSKKESRIEAAGRAARHPIALKVKLADVTDNMDPSRIAAPTKEDYARLEEYKDVKTLLLAALAAGA